MIVAATLSALSAALSHAVHLDPGGLGQALIYPYYTARATADGAFNTYVSVTNTTEQVKAIRVRFREGKAGREVANFNLYLQPRSMWTGAVLPTEEGARLTTDAPFCVTGFSSGTGIREIAFSNAAFSGQAADAFDRGLDRTREGYVEMIEMATLTGASERAAWIDNSGIPIDCAALTGETATVSVAAPRGGLSGTLTLINVAKGLDFTLKAEALADLATQPFHRPAGDPYPDFTATEITPVSVVIHGGFVWRSVWTSGVDAVAGALYRGAFVAEYVLDSGTHSRTDHVFLQPLSRFGAGYWTTDVGETVANRDGLVSALGSDPGSGSPEVDHRFPYAASVSRFYPRSVSTEPAGGPSPVLGSTNVTRFPNLAAPSVQDPELRSDNGKIIWGVGNPANEKTSLPGSTRWSVATGELRTGAHAFRGTPAVGFLARTFENGTLACAAGRCQGNYGGASPVVSIRYIQPAN